MRERLTRAIDWQSAKVRAVADGRNRFGADDHSGLRTWPRPPGRAAFDPIRLSPEALRAEGCPKSRIASAPGEPVSLPFGDSTYARSRPI